MGLAVRHWKRDEVRCLFWWEQQVCVVPAVAVFYFSIFSFTFFQGSVACTIKTFVIYCSFKPCISLWIWRILVNRWQGTEKSCHCVCHDREASRWEQSTRYLPKFLLFKCALQSKKMPPKTHFSDMALHLMFCPSPSSGFIQSVMHFLTC